MGIEPTLSPRLSELAAGRVIVIDYFATRRCGPPVGDLVVRIRESPPGRDHLPIGPVEGVSVVVHRDLLPLLERAGPSLRLAGLPFARRLGIALDHPELWIDFLDRLSCHR
jgi:hypothetical protein